jgi:glycosyltransferase involved in cell wall biosynthesis
MKHENNPLRVLVVTSTFPRWKNDTDPSFVFELCQQLNKSNFIIDVLAPHAYGAKKHEVIDDINIYRYQYFINKWQNLSYTGGILANLKKHAVNYLLIPFFLSAQLLFLYKRLNTERYDLIHAHWLIPQGFICAVVNKLRGSNAIPVLCTAHGSDLVSLKDPLTVLLKSWTIANIAKVSLVSKSLLAYMDGLNIVERDVEICPMGVDFNSTFKVRPEIKREHNKLIYVGRLIKEKGVRHILEALKIVREDHPDVTLDIIGDGPERDELEDLSRESDLSDSVTFFGALNKNELPKYYSRAAIALVPSIVQEGFGLVIIEAMACGCATIVSDFDTSREIITPKVNGLLSLPANSSDIANKINDLFSNKVLLETILNNGRDSVVAKFNWPIIANRYAELMAGIIKNKQIET